MKQRASVWTSLREEAQRYTAVYAAGLARQPALAPYASPPALLAFLEGRTTNDRLAVLAALTAEQHAAPHPLWQALLLVAFEPMLLALRARLGRPRDEDLDQQVILAFLSTVRSVHATPVAGYLPLALQRETARVLFLALEPPRPTEPFDEEAHVPPEELDRGQAALFALVLDESGPELAAALVETCERSESLRAYVDRTRADLPLHERTAIYRRLLCEKQRVIQRVRELAAP